MGGQMEKTDPVGPGLIWVKVPEGGYGQREGTEPPNESPSCVSLQ